MTGGSPATARAARYWNPTESGFTAAAVGSLHEVFTAPLPPGRVDQAIVVGGSVITVGVVGSEARLVALDATTGTTRWTTVLSTSAARVTAVLGEASTVYVGFVGTDGNASVVGVSVSDGAVQWTTPVAVGTTTHPAWIRQMVAIKGTLVIATYYPTPDFPPEYDFLPEAWSASVVGLELTTGARRYEFAYGEAYSVNLLRALPSGLVAQASTYAYLVPPYVEVRSTTVFDAASGASVAAPPPPSPSITALVASGDRFYGSNEPDGDLTAYDPDTLDVVWTRTGSGYPIAATSRTLLSRTADGLRAHDPATGAVQWSITQPAGTTASGQGRVRRLGAALGHPGRDGSDASFLRGVVRSAHRQRWPCPASAIRSWPTVACTSPSATSSTPTPSPDRLGPWGRMAASRRRPRRRTSWAAGGGRAR